MRRIMRAMAAGLVLALAGCAHDTYREEPHHFSKDQHGRRLACFTTDVENEYECVPAYRSYPYAYRDPFYDPFWGAGVLYYPDHHHHARPAPPARPSRSDGRWYEKR